MRLTDFYEAWNNEPPPVALQLTQFEPMPVQEGQHTIKVPRREWSSSVDR